MGSDGEHKVRTENSLLYLKSWPWQEMFNCNVGDRSQIAVGWEVNEKQGSRLFFFFLRSTTRKGAGLWNKEKSFCVVPWLLREETIKKGRGWGWGSEWGYLWWNNSWRGRVGGKASVGAKGRVAFSLIRKKERKEGVWVQMYWFPSRFEKTSYGLCPLCEVGCKTSLWSGRPWGVPQRVYSVLKSLVCRMVDGSY